MLFFQVKIWVTLNEPWISAWQGLLTYFRYFHTNSRRRKSWCLFRFSLHLQATDLESAHLVIYKKLVSHLLRIPKTDSYLSNTRPSLSPNSQIRTRNVYLSSRPQLDPCPRQGLQTLRDLFQASSARFLEPIAMTIPDRFNRGYFFLQAELGSLSISISIYRPQTR